MDSVVEPSRYQKVRQGFLGVLRGTPLADMGLLAPGKIVNLSVIW